MQALELVIATPTLCIKCQSFSPVVLSGQTTGSQVVRWHNLFTSSSLASCVLTKFLHFRMTASNQRSRLLVLLEIGATEQPAAAKIAPVLVFALTVFAVSLWAGVGGSISGTVTDSQGALVSGSRVTVINGATNLRQTMATDSRGIYSFRELYVGTYEVHVEAQGFRPYRRTGVVVDVNSALIADVSLAVGERTDTLTVSASALQVDTA